MFGGRFILHYYTVILPDFVCYLCFSFTTLKMLRIVKLLANITIFVA